MNPRPTPFPGQGHAALNAPAYGRAVLLALVLADPGIAQQEAPLTPDPPAETSRVIRHVKELLELSPADLKKKLPVELRAVVLHFDRAFNLFFVHDGTGSTFVQLPDKETFQPGQAVQIKGTAIGGQFAPVVSFPQIQTLGPAPLPQARPANSADLASGWLDAQWVETDGIVRAQRPWAGRLRLEVVSGPLRFKAWIQRYDTNRPLDLLDHRVSLRGIVAAQVGPNRQVSGFQLFLNSMDDLKVLEPPLAGGAGAFPRFAKDLLGYGLRRYCGHRVRVQGVVVARWSATGFLLRDPTGAVEIHCASDTPVAPGDAVDVTGFLAHRPCSLRLEDAVAKKIGVADPPRPLTLPAEVPPRAGHHNQLVEVEADLLARVIPQPDVVVLGLQSGGRLLRASLFTTNALLDLAGLQPGSHLRLTGLCRLELADRASGDAESSCEWCDGACSVESDKRPGETRLNLWLRSPADVRLLRGPAPRPAPINSLLLAMVLAVGVAVVGFVMALARRRRTELQQVMQQQVALQSELREHEAHLRRSLEERERIAQDLHDDIIQSIYSVGLGLEDCRRQLRSDPHQAETRLAAAIGALNDLIRNVRSFITGLEPKVLNGRELKTALKSLALTTGESQSQFVIEVDPAAANRLTPDQATQLLHIAKEAMSNSLRHAAATLITVALRRTPAGVQLEVQDDGTGFDPAASSPRGQGLRNMAARARSLGAELQIHSAPGQGCRIVALVP